MGKYMINHSIHGYESVNIDDERICDPNSTVIIVLDESTSASLYKYYNKVVDMLLSGTRLITICVGKESKIRKTIMMLMVSYRNYNVYRVDSLSLITSDYIGVVE